MHFLILIQIVKISLPVYFNPYSNNNTQTVRFSFHFERARVIPGNEASGWFLLQYPVFSTHAPTFGCYERLGILALTLARNFPPGPLCLPLLGNLASIDYKSVQNGWEYLRNNFGPITGLIVPKYKLVITSGWNAISEILANEDFQGRPDACLLRDRFKGGRYGLIFKDGEEWKIQRRFTLHHFRNLGFGRKSHESVILEEIDKLSAEIEGFNGKPFGIQALVGISAINITWHVVGGQRYERDDPKLLKLVQDVEELVHNVNIVGSPAVMFPWLRYLFPQRTGYTSIKNSSEGILEFVRNAMPLHLDNLANDNEESNFISIYLRKMREENSKDQKSSFSMEQLEGICMDLLAAGSDTSTGVVSFSLLFLCLHPEMQQKIFDEIKSITEMSRLPSYEDKPSLVYTSAFMCEVMRFRYPVPTFPPHVATRTSTLAGYTIPRETVLILNVKSVFTDEEYWGDPERFRPERFITEEGKIRKEERFIIFGKGKRSCLGETLARMLAFLTIACLVQRFAFRFPDGEVPADTEGSDGFTLACPNFKIIATPREATNFPTEKERNSGVHV